ncbi:hypothetical protein [Streptomyces sp. NPDC006997]|uniref:hypothetical protein n=1 Tax=Streptomyces sp. NPDC006997 TaxID=3155356 RepID=UPI0033CFDAB3
MHRTSARRRLRPALVALCASALLLAAGTAPTQAAEPEPSGFQAVQVDKADGTPTGGVIPCDWGVRAHWTEGNPADLTYSARFWCPPVPDGPELAGFVEASLWGADGEVREIAPRADVVPYDPSETVSESTVRVNRPSTQFARHTSWVQLLSVDPTKVWVWGALPEGCDGTGSPIASCEIDSDLFTVE